MQGQGCNVCRPLKVSVCLRNKETEEIKEQELFMRLPLMTEGGTFIINGAGKGDRISYTQITRRLL
jgi:DNA-directed RNA polymerase subunit beta